MVIEVEAGSVWSEDTTMHQIVKQAGEEAQQNFENVMQHIEAPYKCTVSSCVVRMVMVEQEKR